MKSGRPDERKNGSVEERKNGRTEERKKSIPPPKKHTLVLVVVACHYVLEPLQNGNELDRVGSTDFQDYLLHPLSAVQ